MGMVSRTLLRVSCVLLISGVGCTPTNRAPEGAQPGSASASRDYAYHIGDRILVHYHFNVRPATLDPASVTQGPVNDWLMRRKATLQSDDATAPEGSDLEVEYQIFKGVQTPETLTIPAFSIRLKAGGSGSLEAPAFQFTEVPVIPPELSNELIEPKPGQEPPLRDDTRLRVRLRAWMGLMLLAGGLFAVREVLARRKTRPFRRTQRAIRAALRPAAATPEIRDGLRMIHRALDETQGETLFRADLPHFFQQHAAFKPLTQDLEFFFHLSSRLFFSEPDAHLEDAERLRLLAFLGRCIKAERGAV